MRVTLREWWKLNGRRSIPWKFTAQGREPVCGEQLDPYPIWIAEVMLQQTQLKVMLPFWERWMEIFPNVSSLAASPEQKVLIYWQGLGYYTRARRLHQASLQLVGLAWPKSLDAWLVVPGIGRTTAGSILSSAFDLPFPILDGNVKRVLSRIVGGSNPKLLSISNLWKLSEYLLDPLMPRDFNQALMDLGSIICTPKNPSCDKCPWKLNCSAYVTGDVDHFPVKSKQKPHEFQQIGVGIVINSQGKVLIDQRNEEGLFGGLWEFPGGKQESGESITATIERELKEELDIVVLVGDELITIDHSYSQRKVRLVVHLCDLLSGEPKPLSCQQFRWVYLSELSNYPFPAANTRMISALLEHMGKLR